jgi:hypothetical protein
VQTFIVVYLAFGFVVGFGLFGWAALSSVRRHGFRNSVTGGAQELVNELPFYWRVPVVAWLGIIALPVLSAWAFIRDGVDALGVIILCLLWLGSFALLRWRRSAKARRDG